LLVKKIFFPLPHSLNWGRGDSSPSRPLLNPKLSHFSSRNICVPPKNGKFFKNKPHQKCNKKYLISLFHTALLALLF